MVFVANGHAGYTKIYHNSTVNSLANEKLSTDIFLRKKTEMEKIQRREKSQQAGPLHSVQANSHH